MSNAYLLTTWSNRSPSSLSNGSYRSFGHRRRRLTYRQAISTGVIDMFSVCVMKHHLERGVIVTHILEEPLLGELLLGQGLCAGLIGLHEVVGFGNITCLGEGFAKGVQLLSGEVRSDTTALKVGKEEQDQLSNLCHFSLLFQLLHFVELIKTQKSIFEEVSLRLELYLWISTKRGNPSKFSP